MLIIKPVKKVLSVCLTHINITSYFFLTKDRQTTM